MQWISKYQFNYIYKFCIESTNMFHGYVVNCWFKLVYVELLKYFYDWELYLCSFWFFFFCYLYIYIYICYVVVVQSLYRWNSTEAIFCVLSGSSGIRHVLFQCRSYCAWLNGLLIIIRLIGWFRIPIVDYCWSLSSSNWLIGFF